LDSCNIDEEEGASIFALWEKAAKAKKTTSTSTPNPPPVEVESQSPAREQYAASNCGSTG